jgi:group I intron endonuclease
MNIYYGIVYKITCIINNKVYVGQTTISIKHRFWCHLRDGRYHDTKLYSAFKKYGNENFKIEEIDGANSQSELNYKEWLWIHKLDCIKNGYNSKEGGLYVKMSNETKLKLSIKLKGRVFSIATIDRMKLGQTKRFKEQSHPRTGCVGKLSPVSKKVLCVNNNKIYDSYRQAAIELGLNRSHISSIIKGKRKSTKGYKFKEVLDNLI